MQFRLAGTTVMDENTFQIPAVPMYPNRIIGNGARDRPRPSLQHALEHDRMGKF